MKDIQLKNLSLDIMEVLDNGRAITEEDLLWFIDAVYEVSAGKLKSNYEFDMLCHDIHAKFAYTDMPDEHSFCAGALWGILKEGEIVRNEQHLSYRKIGQISREGSELLTENAKLRDERDRMYKANVEKNGEILRLLEENAKLRERIAKLDELLPENGRWYRAETVEAYVAEIAKLRELVRELYEDQCDECDQWKYRDRMRELRVEVDE